MRTLCTIYVVQLPQGWRIAHTSHCARYETINCKPRSFHYKNKMNSSRSPLFIYPLESILLYIQERSSNDNYFFNSKEKYSIKRDILLNFVERNKQSKNNLKKKYTTDSIIIYIKTKRKNYDDPLINYQKWLWSNIDYKTTGGTKERVNRWIKKKWKIDDKFLYLQ